MELSYLKEVTVMNLQPVPLHYIREGQGQPVLLLHGWPGFSYDWRRIVPLLAPFCDVIAPDFRGFGQSPKPQNTAYTPQHLAADIIALLDELALSKVIVAAHDMGATIAQTLAQTYPERIASLILLNPPYPGIGLRRFDKDVQHEFWYQQFHNMPWAGAVIGSSKENVRLYLSHFYEHWAGKAAITQDELDTIIDMYSKPGHFEASIAYYKARAAAKTASAITTTAPVTIPHRTTVLWGDADPVMRSDWSDRLADYFDQVTVTLLPGIGHFVPAEAPQDVAAAIRSHLQKSE
jgi:pimeloyl-ACP methyl ester carboxylesterase